MLGEAQAVSVWQGLACTLMGTPLGVTTSLSLYPNLKSSFLPDGPVHVTAIAIITIDTGHTRHIGTEAMGSETR